MDVLFHIFYLDPNHLVVAETSTLWHQAFCLSLKIFFADYSQTGILVIFQTRNILQKDFLKDLPVVDCRYTSQDRFLQNLIVDCLVWRVLFGEFCLVWKILQNLIVDCLVWSRLATSVQLTSTSQQAGFMKRMLISFEFWQILYLQKILRECVIALTSPSNTWSGCHGWGQSQWS